MIGAPPSETEIEAVLEWDLRSPPPLPYAEIERIVTETLIGDPSLPNERRKELLLRRGMVRAADPTSEKQSAAADLAECHKLDPADVFVNCHRIAAESAEELYAGSPRRLMKARGEAESLITANPNDPLPRWALAVVLFDESPKDYARIFRLLDESTRLQSDFIAGHSGKAAFYLNVFDYESCIKSCRLAEQCTSNDRARVKAHCSYIEGEAYLYQGDYATALPLLADAAHLFPDRGVVRFHLWNCLSCLGRQASADVVADEWIKLQPTLVEARIAKLISILVRGDSDAAYKKLKEMETLKLKGCDGLIQWCIGRLAEREEPRTAIGRHEDAIPRLKKWRGREVQWLDAQFRVALLYAAAGEKRARNGGLAVIHAEDLVDRLADGPALRKAHLILACAYAEQGEFENAISRIDLVLKMEGLTDEEKKSCDGLRGLFSKDVPYRLAAPDAKDRFLEIPARACYFGPLKTIRFDVD